ncbi:RHS repeat-associated core domain-containing protein [Pseudoalteromonas spongiae]|uniref:RHS repeat-associated core domain-containing protein n=1 Tax=Pseudoalteromonas spongiae TaxID=298657 RepID=A0ABU8EY22_9GAMM
MIAETDSLGNRLKTYLYGDDLISQTDSNNTTNTFHYDGLGSTRSLSDDSGEQSDTYDYLAFGELQNQTGTTDNSYLYTGEQFDGDLDQYYLRARYYDQGVGRFTQQDAWMGRDGEPVTLNKYLYTHADPVNGVDPSGYMRLSSLTFGQSIQSSLAGIRTVNYRVFLREAVDGALCLLVEEVTEKVIGEAFSGIYIFSDAHNGNDPYVGRSDNYGKRKSQHDAVDRIKKELVKAELVVDNIFEKFNFSDKKKLVKNQFRLLEQWFIDYVEENYKTPTNSRKEVALFPKSDNSQKIRKLLNNKIDICDSKVKK